MENSCNQYGHEEGCTGATQRAQKGSRATKGNPRAKTTQSNTPLKSAPAANPQTKVNAIDHALKSTQKSGKVEGVAKIGKKSLDIEAGHPDYHGTRHAARHFTPEDTDAHKTAKAIAVGKKEKSDQAVRSTHKTTAAILQPKKEKTTLTTSYRDSRI